MKKLEPVWLKLWIAFDSDPSPRTLGKIDSDVNELICGANSIQTLASTFINATTRLAEGDTETVRYDGLDKHLDASTVKDQYASAVASLITDYRLGDVFLRELSG